MYTDVFFLLFQKKLEDNLTAVTGNIYGDIDFYLEVLKKESTVLEIGTRNGRVLKPLLENGIDIYGIEPEEEMLRYLTDEERQRVTVMGIENLNNLNKNQLFDAIIIPATSISLFNIKVFEQFLIQSKNLLKQYGRILFDFVNPEWLELQDQQVVIDKIDGQLFMSGNFIKKEQFIYNIYTKSQSGEKVLGYSVKNIYSIDKVVAIAEKLGYATGVLQKNKEYIMMEAQLDG